MPKIISTPSCGNSPKMEFIKQFNIAFAEGDIKLISASITNDVVWNIIGDNQINGIDQFITELEKMNSSEVAELIINQIISHGKSGAARGVIRMKNGNEFAFCDFYTFKGAKSTLIKEITSYVIKL